MLSLCMKLLETDNEENAVICLRIIFDLHKSFRPNLEREVEPFLQFVQRIYTGLPKTVAQVFSDAKPPQPQQPPGQPQQLQQVPGQPQAAASSGGSPKPSAVEAYTSAAAEE